MSKRAHPASLRSEELYYTIIRLNCPGTQTAPLDGQIRSLVNAVDAKTGESFTVMAPTMYEAAVELAEQVGFDLRDG